MRRDRGLAAHPADLDGDLASIESSFGVLADAVTPHRAPDQRAAHLDGVRRR